MSFLPPLSPKKLHQLGVVSLDNFRAWFPRSRFKTATGSCFFQRDYGTTTTSTKQTTTHSLHTSEVLNLVKVRSGQHKGWQFCRRVRILVLVLMLLSRDVIEVLPKQHQKKSKFKIPPNKKNMWKTLFFPWKENYLTFFRVLHEKSWNVLRSSGKRGLGMHKCQPSHDISESFMTMTRAMSGKTDPTGKCVQQHHHKKHLVIATPHLEKPSDFHQHGSYRVRK